MVGFHLDDESHWVADLECGHTQHVRHKPPWENRPWVVTPEGRGSKIGQTLNCKICDDDANDDDDANANKSASVTTP